MKFKTRTIVILELEEIELQTVLDCVTLATSGDERPAMKTRERASRFLREYQEEVDRYASAGHPDAGQPDSQEFV